MTAPTSQSSASRRERAAEPRGERGFAALWMAMLVFVLLGVAAFAVDLVHAVLVQQEAQNAADAASLGGVVYLPSDPTTASAKAMQIAGDNGFAAGGNTTVTATQQAVATQLKVDVTRKFDTFFARAIGFKTLTVHKSAIADYDQPVAMGSPSNTFGNQPDCTAPCTNTPGSENPQLWFNVAGPDSPKQSGDAYAARLCTATADNCPGSTNGNTDYDGTGYTYVIHNTNSSGLVGVQVYDPVFVGVGDHCTDTTLAAVQTAAGGSARYATGDGAYCSGDQYFQNSGTPYADEAPPETTYTLSWDPGTPWTTLDDSQICTNTFHGFMTAQAAWNDTVNGRPYFRQWVSICGATHAARFGSTAGDYLLTINTTSGAGHNRGAIRACAAACPSALNASNLSIYAESRMSIYANAGTTNSQFYMARVLPGAAGRTLVLNFFDTGDAGSPGTIKVLPPPDSNVSKFTGCTYTAPAGNATGPPWGSFSATNTDCSVDNVSGASGWNGQWVTWKVPVANNYTCKSATSTGCWVKLQISLSGGVQDTTTWTAHLEGNPVRLVK